jgi:hypothetical protein
MRTAQQINIFDSKIVDSRNSITLFRCQNMQIELTRMMGFAHLSLSWLHTFDRRKIDKNIDAIYLLHRNFVCINITITILEVINNLISYLKYSISETGLRVRRPVEPTQLGTIGRAILSPDTS